MTPHQRSLLDPPLLDLAAPGLTMSAIEYRRIEQRREAFARRMCWLHRDYDLLITPQLAVPAFETGTEVPRGTGRTRWWEWSPFTYPFNLSQQPAATVPCGFTRTGLPVAMQVVGDKFADAKVLRAARAYEAAHPFRMPQVSSIAAATRPMMAPTRA
jgi:aspartyl-tRNA(Asn)/glutamyl-tRNA(Gln) amidotransferase subunit A